jgi:hypothetical protein
MEGHVYVTKQWRVPITIVAMATQQWVLYCCARDIAANNIMKHT